MSELTILVVDDDDDLRGAMADALEGEGYAVLSLGDARQALAAMRGGYRPDIILMDLMMPGMNGWELRDELAADPELMTIPLIVVTALQRTDRRVEGMDVLHKPFALDQLIAVVEGRRKKIGRKGAKA